MVTSLASTLGCFLVSETARSSSLQKKFARRMRLLFAGGSVQDVGAGKNQKEDSENINSPNKARDVMQGLYYENPTSLLQFRIHCVVGFA